VLPLNAPGLLRNIWSMHRVTLLQSEKFRFAEHVLHQEFRKRDRGPVLVYDMFIVN